LPIEVDLRGYEYMHLYGDRLLSSETWLEGEPEEKVAMINIWWRAFAKEIPAASLPENDKLLTNYAGFGMALSAWKKARPAVLRGFVPCSDGRLWHPFLAKIALTAWRARLADRMRGAKARIGSTQKKLKDTDLSERDRQHLSQMLKAQEAELSQITEWSVTAASWVVLSQSQIGEERIGEDRIGEKTKTPTRSQPPVADPPAAAEPAAPSARPPEQPTPERQAAERRGLFAKALRDEGVTNVTPSVPTIVDWANNPKASVQLLREGVDLARDKKPKPEQIPLAYLKPIVEELLNPKPPGERSARHQAASGFLDWWASPSSVFAKAEAEGVPIATRDNGDGVMVRDHLVTLARLCVKLGEGSWFDRRNLTLVRIVDEIKARAGAEA
jgi:hypothetical protein